MLDCLLALMLIRKASSVKPPLPKRVKSAMVSNIVLDFLLGLVPLIGDIADAFYKCNTKNFLLLEKELIKRAEKRQKGAGAVPISTGGLDSPQDYEGFDDKDENDALDGPPPRYASTKQPRRPDPAYDRYQSEGRGGYFGGRQEVDLENGEGIPPPGPSRR
jgi:Domain of unknown function (DUF4112)